VRVPAAGRPPPAPGGPPPQEIGPLLAQVERRERAPQAWIDISTT
jgi:hypothetical protein